MLALGQIIASNSYQITLLTGEIGQSADKLYAIAGIYLAFSIIWGVSTRFVKLYYLLTLPFFLYGSAFLLIGTSPFVQNLNGRFWMQNVATGVYAAASASGSLFFAFNFGDEGKMSRILIRESVLIHLFSQAVRLSPSGSGERAGSKPYNTHIPWRSGSGAASSPLSPPRVGPTSACQLFPSYFQSHLSSPWVYGVSASPSSSACLPTIDKCPIKSLHCSDRS